MAADWPTMALSTLAGEKGTAGRGSTAVVLPLTLDPRQQRKDVLVAERLGEKVEGPQLDRLDGHGNAAIGGHHDDFDVGGRALLDPLQQLDAVENGHLQIGHHHVEPLGGQLLQGFLAVGGAGHLVPLCGQIVSQSDAFDFFVIDDEDFHGEPSEGQRPSNFLRASIHALARLL